MTDQCSATRKSSMIGKIFPGTRGDAGREARLSLVMFHLFS